MPLTTAMACLCELAATLGSMLRSDSASWRVDMCLGVGLLWRFAIYLLVLVLASSSRPGRGGGGDNLRHVWQPPSGRRDEVWKHCSTQICSIRHKGVAAICLLILFQVLPTKAKRDTLHWCFSGPCRQAMMSMLFRPATCEPSGASFRALRCPHGLVPSRRRIACPRVCVCVCVTCTSACP